MHLKTTIPPNANCVCGGLSGLCYTYGVDIWLSGD